MKDLILKKLLKIAMERYGKNICPVMDYTWERSLTACGLWFNTADKSTHLISIKEINN